MQRGCFANSFCQRLCSGLSWAEVPYERAMAKLKAALSSPPPPAVGVRGTQAGPGRWHRSTSVTLLEVPFPEGAAKATVEVLPRRGQSLPQHRGNARASASRWELLGLCTLFVGTAFAFLSLLGSPRRYVCHAEFPPTVSVTAIPTSGMKCEM